MALRAVGVDVVLAKISHDTLKRPSQVAGLLVYGFLLLTATLVALDVLGLDAAATLLHGLVDYLPRLVVALVMLALGLYLVEFVSELLNSLNVFGKHGMAPLIRSAIRVLLLGLVLLAVAEQLDIATVLLTIVFAAFLGGLALTMVLAFGLGGRELLSHVLAGYALRSHIGPGVNIEWHDLQGEILRVHWAATEIRVNGKTKVVPNTELLASNFSVNAPQ